MAKRQPKAVYELARALWKEGKSVVEIMFQVPLDETQIRRACDPAFAEEQSNQFAKRTVLRKRGVRV